MSLFDKLKKGLVKTRSGIVNSIKGLLKSFKKIDEELKKLVSDYNDLLLDKINEINSLVMDLETLCDNDFYTKYLNSIKPLLLSTNYNSIKSNIDFKSPRLPNNSSDDLKNIKSLISDKVKDLKSDLIYENIDDIKCFIYNTKDYVSSIIDIIKRLIMMFMSLMILLNLLLKK